MAVKDEGSYALLAPEQEETDLQFDKPQGESFSVAIGPERRFKDGILDVCGRPRCEDGACAVCALVSFCPCIPFGSNAERSLGKPRWIYTLLSFFLMVFVYYVYNVVDGMLVVKMISLCAGPQTQSSLAKCQEAIAEREHIRNIVIGLSIITSLAMALWGAKTRSDMRKKFNIPGSFANDLLLWCCLRPCALCQETRTVRHNNIEDGVWHGPSPSNSSGS